MKIKEIRAVEIELNPKPTTTPRTPSRARQFPMNRPVTRYAAADRRGEHVSGSGWSRPACIVTAEDGTWGFGISLYGGPVTPIINDHFAPRLVGENCMATEKLWDLMVAIECCLRCHRLNKLRHQCCGLCLVGPQRQNPKETGLRTARWPPRRKKFSAMPPVSIRNGIWNSDSKRQNFSPRGGPIHGLEGLRKLEELVATTRENDWQYS